MKVREGTIGRDRELAIADTFLATGEERCTVLELAGEPGIGKTTVWLDVLDRAHTRGFLVLSCHGAETEMQMALSAVTDLLAPVGSDAIAALPAPQRRAIETALLRTQPEGAPPQPRTLATAVRTLLVELSTQRPVLIAIDDSQWLDAASKAILGFSLRRLVDEPVAWLLTRRSATTPSFDLDRLVVEGLATRAELGPLSLAAIHHALEDRLQRPLTRPMLVHAYRAAGGNPFFAIEIARELIRIGPSTDGATPVPATLRELLTSKIRRLPVETRSALLVASALVEPTTGLVDERALAPAEDADVVQVGSEGHIRFRHPLLAAAVYGSASQADRRQVHASMALRVTDPEERARHLALATTQPDERVARLLEEGAARARSRGAWGSAAEMLERARDLTPARHVERMHRRGISAAEHHVHAGDRARGRALLEQLLAEPLSRPERADALRLLAEVSSHDENFVGAVRLFEQALSYSDDLGCSIAIEIGLAFTAAYVHALDFQTSWRHAQRALELAEAAGDEGSVGQALAYTAMFEFLCGHGVDWIKVERSLALEDQRRVVPFQYRPDVVDAFLHLYVGNHAEARDRFRRLSAAATEEGDESDLAFILLWSSWLETRCGSLRDAVGLAEEAATVARLTGSGSLEAWARMQRAYVGAHLGEVEETRRACDEGRRLMQRYGSEMLGLWIGASSALLEISLERPDAAHDACAPMLALIEKEGIGEPVPLFFLPDAVEALIARGDLDRAEALLDTLRARGRALDRPWALVTEARCRALLLAARGDLEGAAASIDGALTEHDRIALPLELGRTLLTKGAIERRLRRRADARTSFERALEIFERIGAPLWAKRARGELDRLGLRRGAGNELTEAERRVAELTARGMRRREVAAALFVSPKTVDATLVRVYRKLDVRTRAELGAHMAHAASDAASHDLGQRVQG